jgi:hypothetical protein
MFTDTSAAFASDAVLWPPGEPPVRGTAAIRDWYLRSFDQSWTISRDVESSRICIDKVLTVVEVEISIERGSRRTREPGGKVRESYVVVLQQGKRRFEIKHVMWRPVP